MAAVFDDTAGHGITHSLRLLIDFFQHEVLKTAFFGCFRIPVDFEYFFADRRTVNILYPDSILGYSCDFTVIHYISAACFRNDSRNIGSDEIFAITEANNKRIIFLRTNQFVRLSRTHEN
ncbi:hypothetical protein SDC9_196469 [bioreactor metagenome]|uniref:Uncharacterized protein n=1 Tax=bioreactor metagenome TaxID=1076179 RepID=A0A645IC89_9ZZZZ